MNILNQNSMNCGIPNSLPPDIAKNVSNIKQLRNICNGDAQALVRQLTNNNPQLKQYLQSFQGQDLSKVVKSLCAQKGISYDALMDALK